MFDLDDAEVARYGQLGKEAQDFVKGEDEAVVKRLFAETGFEKSRVEEFYGYGEDTRNLILNLWGVISWIGR